jgi:hypothetical protein
MIKKSDEGSNDGCYDAIGIYGGPLFINNIKNFIKIQHNITILPGKLFLRKLRKEEVGHDIKILPRKLFLRKRGEVSWECGTILTKITIPAKQKIYVTVSHSSKIISPQKREDRFW